jgi:hypothetical protein
MACGFGASLVAQNPCQVIFKHNRQDPTKGDDSATWMPTPLVDTNKPDGVGFKAVSEVLVLMACAVLCCAAGFMSWPTVGWQS